jgi:tetratricopeptide (TPR) repeat protein
MTMIVQCDRLADSDAVAALSQQRASIEQIDALLLENPWAAIELAGPVRDHARATGDKATLMKALYLLDAARMHADQSPAVFRDAMEALRLAEEAGDWAWQARICNGLGVFELNAGHVESAIGLQFVGLQLSRERGDCLGVGRALSALAFSLMRVGLTDFALPMLEEARRIYLEAQAAGLASLALWYIGRNRFEHSVCARRHGDPAGEKSAAREALDLLRRARSEPQAGVSPITQIDGRIHMSFALLALGDAVQAQQVLDDARAMLLSFPRRPLRAACEVVQAGILLATSRPAQALEMLESLLAGPLWPTVFPEERLIVLEAVASAHEMLGQYCEAVTAFRRFSVACACVTDEASRTRAALLAHQWPAELKSFLRRSLPEPEPLPIAA